MDIKNLLENSNLNIPKENIKYNEPMSKHTSFKVGGAAECFIKIQTIEELKEITNFIQKNKINSVIIGNGSNILVTDKGIKGIVLQICRKKCEIAKLDEVKIKATIGAGNKMSEIAQKFLKEEITGFEELSGIPGTIGGAIKMNAGAHKKEIKDILESVTILDEDNKLRELTNEELHLEYRRSILFEKKYIVIEAKFNLQKGKYEEINSKMQEYKKYRQEKQPIEYPSAGSTFKRGENYITAKLIDDAGLKGYTIGGAQVSEKHAGFVINKGNATAKDILELIEYIKEKVYKTSKEKINLEIEVIGEK